MKNISHFIQYNNIVPLLVSVLFVGAGASFAATDAGSHALGQALVGEVRTVISIDNTYIVGKDFSSWSPLATVTEVKQDYDTYYVSYSLATIDIQDYVWRDVAKTVQLIVTKDELARYKDLASYVQVQLKEVVTSEMDRLVRTQEIQKREVTQKTIATEYTGLIGAVLSTTTTVEDPYAVTPSTDVPAPLEEQVPAVQTANVVTAVVTPEETNAQEVSQGQSETAPFSELMTPDNGSDSTENAQTEPAVQENASTPEIPPAPPTESTEPVQPEVILQMLGSELVTLVVGETYTDLGALARTETGETVPVLVSLNGSNLNDGVSVQIDTLVVGEHTIMYTVLADTSTPRSLTRRVRVTSPQLSESNEGTDAHVVGGQTSAPAQTEVIVAPEEVGSNVTPTEVN